MEVRVKDSSLPQSSYQTQYNQFKKQNTTFPPQTDPLYYPILNNLVHL